MIMSQITVSYVDVLTKQYVQNWGDSHQLDAEMSIALHFEERFGAKMVRVESARSLDEDVLILEIITDHICDPREFALSREGSLMW